MFGAQGIRETQYPEATYKSSELEDEYKEMSGDGYHAVYKKNSKGNVVVDFYYNPEGFRSFWVFERYIKFWTSSVNPVVSDQAITFSGAKGMFGGSMLTEYYRTSTLCIE